MRAPSGGHLSLASVAAAARAHILRGYVDMLVYLNSSFVIRSIGFGNSVCGHGHDNAHVGRGSTVVGALGHAVECMHRPCLTELELQAIF